MQLISVGCKNNVLRLASDFDWTRFPLRRICFFVDRDLSDFIHEDVVLGENVYVTDGYSIENCVANIDIFRRLLSEILNISDLKPSEFDILERNFLSALNSFQENMIPVMAQIILWRRGGEWPDLKLIRPSDLFFFENGKMKLVPKFETAHSRLQHVSECVKLKPSQNTDLSRVESEFRQRQGAERFIRGKYIMWFFIQFSLEVHRSIASVIGRFSESPSKKCNIGVKNAMVLLAPRVRCPVSLRDFLMRTYNQYICDVDR